MELVEFDSHQAIHDSLIGTIAHESHASQYEYPQVIASVDDVGTVLLENAAGQNGKKYRILVGSILGEAVVSTE